LKTLDKKAAQPRIEKNRGAPRIAPEMKHRRRGCARHDLEAAADALIAVQQTPVQAMAAIRAALAYADHCQDPLQDLPPWTAIS
jgi:hypothetical protein